MQLTALSDRWFLLPVASNASSVAYYGGGAYLDCSAAAVKLHRLLAHNLGAALQ